MSRAGTKLDDQAIKLLREYLRIPTAHPNIDYGPCEEWIRIQAASIGLPVHVERPCKEKPVLIITWLGSEPELPSIMLNSHMDVVPADEEKWTHPPFAAERTENGNIYARGSQDMKSHGVQYLEAVRRLRIKGFQPRRTVHIVFVPDEEMGGLEGMGAFVKTKHFEEMNVGFELDEGMAWPGEEFVVYNAERSTCKVEFVCHGTPGHSLFLMDAPAFEKVRVILNRLVEYRTEECKHIKQTADQGSVTSMNITKLLGGDGSSMVPSVMSIVTDIRISPDQDHQVFFKKLQEWCEEAGDTELRFHIKEEAVGVTELNESNKWWQTLKSVLERLNHKVRPAVCPRATDARFLRGLKIPAIGLTLINNTPPLMHDHDEYINEKVFLHGITIYEKLLRNLTML